MSDEHDKWLLVSLIDALKNYGNNHYSYYEGKEYADELLQILSDKLKEYDN